MDILAGKMLPEKVRFGLMNSIHNGKLALFKKLGKVMALTLMDLSKLASGQQIFLQSGTHMKGELI